MAVKRTMCNRGVTLMEMMVVVFILGILALGLPKIFLQITKSLSAASADISAQQNSRIASLELFRLMNSARYSTVTISQEAGEPAYSKISFTNLKGQVEILFQRQNSLWHSRNGVEHNLLKDGIVRLAFAYPNLSDPQLIKVTLSAKNNDSTKEKQILGTATKNIRLENP